MSSPFFSLGISNLQKLVLKILGSHACTIVLDKKAVPVPLDKNLDLLRVGVPRIGNRLPQNSRKAAVETAAQMIQNAQGDLERKLRICRSFHEGSPWPVPLPGLRRFT